MRALLRPFLLPFLRRDEGEIVRRASGFHIESETGRTLVSDLGAAFLRGFNATLDLRDLKDVAEAGATVPVHYRPFYFEGAAMGYLPRGYVSSRFTAARAERDLLGMDGAYLYLYYVGLGFWYGMRYPSRPGRLEKLAPHLDPLYFPLCYDGFGFKLGFFDFPRRSSAVAVLGRVPVHRHPHIVQGFGRSLFFVFMDDASGYEKVKAGLPGERRWDLEFGRSLAFAFTGIDRPGRIADYVAAAPDETNLSARLTGVTWAVTARKMNDAAYLTKCLGTADAPGCEWLGKLPDLCKEALESATDYGDWQSRTCEAVLRLYEGNG